MEMQNDFHSPLRPLPAVPNLALLNTTLKNQFTENAVLIQ
jgi:hypothetical protein